MDRGAARSRKRAAKLTQAPISTSSAVPTSRNPSLPFSPSSRSPPSLATPSTSKHDASALHPSSERYNQKRHLDKEQRVRLKAEKQRQHEDISNPDRFKPKAVRTSTALIYSSSPFDIPPSREKLENITRLDLSGSETEDVTWVGQAKKITWLNLAGCKIKRGWESLEESENLTVLNISNTGLKALPPALMKLNKLKALVCMNNPLENLDEGVVSEWKELNSLIISHSPLLKLLPSSLSSLSHLSKLTFSHCPLLTPSSIPDLSSLPLLRDVKMHSLPLLTSLPLHLSTWGTGDFTQIGKVGKGGGLEVLDIGNCSLSLFSVLTFFPSDTSVSDSNEKSNSRWGNLRSLTLRGNPLTEEDPSYVDKLSSANMPNLQIIDNKRIRERKRIGEIQESKEDRKMREKRERWMKPSGENLRGGKMRKWGVGLREDDQQKERILDEDGSIRGDMGFEDKRTKSSKSDRSTNIGERGRKDGRGKEGNETKSIESQVNERKKKRLLEKEHNDQNPTSTKRLKVDPSDKVLSLSEQTWVDQPIKPSLVKNKKFQSETNSTKPKSSQSDQSIKPSSNPKQNHSEELRQSSLLKNNQIDTDSVDPSTVKPSQPHGDRSAIVEIIENHLPSSHAKGKNTTGVSKSVKGKKHGVEDKVDSVNGGE
ncbi:hypothetical protein TREMEDRAFT_61533 [Tremella mesenterica DSM 1558]|uniref:uncharacterized protein n=1 Tax=Tremella mesenterica (strain ATCC 24925 / CBS 8224 / DSM 1558 / NBRC 9311 / NRRL Y-6157 / RJB 2259-6 / UBC 559-6) TaxID=578456 RepID=UPI0003F4A112|nr:uncharacterized protein TREMEDRAFT_61533 [Tremella mesenterica DSM 1558]EIW69768.1 hypothetical protein TREMEDRAFT_61533 [Tremella mesenterica DSM 1558]